MTITAKIRIFQWAAVISLILLTVVASWTMMRSAGDQSRIQAAYENYIDILTLSKQANRFSEQIAELLLLGEETLPDYESARNQLSTGFMKLEVQMTRGETGAGNEPMDSCSFCDPERLADLRRLFHEIEATVDDILMLMRQDRLPKAIELFRETIEMGLDSKVERLLADARNDEQKILHETANQATLMRQRVTSLFGAIAVFMILTTLVSGVHFKRALFYPIDRLIQGVQTLGQGDLDHRITYSGTDELSLVARRINEMAAELKDQRNQLLSAHASLESEVRQRTDELTRANQRLTDLDRLRVLFLADISHELRTPLTVLRGEAEVALRQEPEQQGYRRALERIRRKGEEMSLMVDDLLFLARAEADTVRFDKQRTGLLEIIESTLHDGNILAWQYEITIDKSLPPNDVLVEVDPQRLKQALMVLIVNAIQHSDKGSRISLEVIDSDATATIRVEDKGHGISAEDLPYVFERFHRSRNSRSASRNTGNGIGLHIAKWIVEKHKGSLTLASDTNGTVVELSLQKVT